MPRSTTQTTSAYPHRPPTSDASLPVNAPKRSQRERLVDAMLELSATTGYHSVTVAQVSSRAGVSSATFYEQFEGKDDCMVAAYRAAVARIFARARLAASTRDWHDAARDALERLMGAVQENPHAARLLFVEALGAGPELRDERQRVVAGFEQIAEAVLARQQDDTLDIPIAALTGAIRHIVSRYLRTHAEDRLPSLTDDLVSWVESYATPAAAPRWSSGPDALLPRARTALSATRRVPTRIPTRLPRGRHGLPAGVVARSHRTRIIYGAAEAMMVKGYAHTTVADIVAAAGVARDVFYEHFTDKQDAFLEAQQHPTQYILDVCATAYFAEQEWPERVWSYLQTLIRLITENPAISHLRLVECYAAGPKAIRRAEEITRAFGIFLQEGYNYGAEARERPRLCSQAITGAIYEIIQRSVALGRAGELPRQLPQMVYVALAPFTGATEAIAMMPQLRARYDDAGQS